MHALPPTITNSMVVELIVICSTQTNKQTNTGNKSKRTRVSILAPFFSFIIVFAVDVVVHVRKTYYCNVPFYSTPTKYHNLS